MLEGNADGDSGWRSPFSGCWASSQIPSVLPADRCVPQYNSLLPAQAVVGNGSEPQRGASEGAGCSQCPRQQLVASSSEGFRAATPDLGAAKL